jgi:hypothetical protein
VRGSTGGTGRVPEQKHSVDHDDASLDLQIQLRPTPQQYRALEAI